LDSNISFAHSFLTHSWCTKALLKMAPRNMFVALLFGIQVLRIQGLQMPNVKISRSAGLSTSTASNSRLFTLDDASKAPTEYSLYGLSEDVKHISYGENSRQYRRTVYTHDDWVRHRRSGRFAHNLKTMWTSGVYKSLFNQVLATTGMATLAVLWNALVPRCFRKLPNLSLPMTPFTLLAPSLGLLLGTYVALPICCCQCIAFVAADNSL
jgi:hypothetical protein